MAVEQREHTHVKLYWWLIGATDFIKWAGTEMAVWPFEQKEIHGRDIYFHPSPKDYYAIRFRKEQRNVISWYIENDRQRTYSSARWLHFWLPDPTSDELDALRKVGCDVSVRPSDNRASFNVDTREQIQAVQDIVLKRYDSTLSVTRK